MPVEVVWEDMGPELAVPRFRPSAMPDGPAGPMGPDHERQRPAGRDRRGGHVGLPASPRHVRARRARPGRRPGPGRRRAHLADVDGFATTGFFPMYATGVAEYLGLHPIYFDETNSGGSSFEVLVEHAAYAIEAGAAEVVLVTYGSVQLSQMGRRLGTGGGGGGGFAPGPAIYDALWGNTLVGQLRLGGPSPHARVRHHP